jgi:hypothetical protein
VTTAIVGVGHGDDHLDQHLPGLHFRGGQAATALLSYSVTTTTARIG